MIITGHITPTCTTEFDLTIYFLEKFKKKTKIKTFSPVSNS